MIYEVSACKLKNAEQATMIGMQSIQQIKSFVFVSWKANYSVISTAVQAGLKNTSFQFI